MTIQAVLFGAIGTLVETSDLQRRAFNLAFVEEGVDWFWDKATYAELLKGSGGAARVAAFAAELGETVDAKAVHATKVRIFGELLRAEGAALRPGIRDLINAARGSGLAVGFATSTSAAQVQQIFDALGGALRREEFDYVGDASRVARGKPAPDIYDDALGELGVNARDAIAIEDSPSSAQAAIAAGLTTYVTPGTMHRNHAFPEGVIRVPVLSAEMLMQGQIAAE